jgi:NAD(P)-dependent dehydrogenase (short-subunit alcohol dehydrogenase family)
MVKGATMNDVTTLPSVLVTGGAKRIGSVVARAFAAAGWHAVIHYGNSRQAAENLAAKLPSAQTIHCDLSDGRAAEEMVERLAGELADWRVLVNCAAIFHPDSAERLDAETFSEAMTVNAATPTRMAQAFLRSARAANGRCVIDFLDMKLVNPNPDFFSYTMSKHAFAATVRMQAMAATDPKDRIYGLAPGAMLPSHDQLDEEHEVSGRLNLLGRLNDPQDLADAAVFLSDRWLASGETLFVDSGQHLLSQSRDVLYLARGLS